MSRKRRLVLLSIMRNILQTFTPATLYPSYSSEPAPAPHYLPNPALTYSTALALPHGRRHRGYPRVRRQRFPSGRGRGRSAYRFREARAWSRYCQLIAEDCFWENPCARQSRERGHLRQRRFSYLDYISRHGRGYGPAYARYEILFPMPGWPYCAHCSVIPSIQN